MVGKAGKPMIKDTLQVDFFFFCHCADNRFQITEWNCMKHPGLVC